MQSRSNLRNSNTGRKFSFNPLRIVIENPQYPLARIYRESFWTGLSDTYNVLLGHDEEGKWLHPGVLDVLGYPLLARFLLANAAKHQHSILAALGGFIGSAIYWAHSILGAALTLALSEL